MENEELVMRNTYINAQMGPITIFGHGQRVEEKEDKIRWIDDNQDDKDRLRTNPSETDLCLKEEVVPIDVHWTKWASKPIIKTKEVDPVIEEEKGEDDSIKFYQTTDIKAPSWLEEDSVEVEWPKKKLKSRPNLDSELEVMG